VNGSRPRGAPRALGPRAWTLALAATTQLGCGGSVEARGAGAASHAESVVCATIQDPGGPASVVDDASIATDEADPSRASTSDGASFQLRAGWVGTRYERALLRFDLAVAGVPPGSTIASASLDLQLAGVSGQGALDVYAAPAAWSEAAVTWSALAAAPGGGLGPLVGTVSPAGLAPGATLSIALPPALVQAWLDPAANTGVVLDHPLPGRVVALSSEAPLAASRPRLYQTKRGQWQVGSQLEADGFGPEVLTERDVDEDPSLLDAYQVVVLACHHEYVSRAFYDALLAHHAAGRDLAFFSANDLWWQVRYTPSGDRLVRYRDYAMTQDPMLGVDDSMVTTSWSSGLLGRPGEALEGVSFQTFSYQFQAADDFVQDASSWFFQGTGLADGDVFGSLVAAGETDATTPLSPPGVEVLLTAQRATPAPGYAKIPVASVAAAAVFYADDAAHGAPNGAGGQVFAAGTTLGWGDGLMAGAPGYQAVRKATRNVIEHMIAF
jgi:hypothetical protein